MRRGVPAILVILVVAGCIQSSPVGERERVRPVDEDLAWSFRVPVLVDVDCGSCFEPTVAWDDVGRLFVVAGGGLSFSVSRDGGLTFDPLERPPVPVAGWGTAGDVFLQTDAEGRLWWSGLAFGARGQLVTSGVHVARSDDGGASWPVNTIITYGSPEAAPVTDRQWLAFAPNGDVYVVCTCPAVASVMLSKSTDDGASFSPFLPVPASGRPGPAGQPVVDADGVLVIPYLVGVEADATGGLRAHAVAVAVSSDGGTTFATRWVTEPTPEARLVCCGFPGAVVHKGSVVVGWTMDAGPSMTAHSTDGGQTWSAPAAWGTNATGRYPHPWLASDGPALYVAWFEQVEDAVELIAARGDLDGAQAQTKLARLPLPSTDFPHLAAGPRGVAATWADEAIWVAVAP